MRRQGIAALLVAMLMVVLAGCGSDGDGATPSGATAATSDATAPATDGTAITADESAAGPLRILVTNDDGVDAPGLDALVEGLRTLDDVEIVVVTPLEDQSGTSDATSDGPLEADRSASTLSGHPAVAVIGYPADAVVWALDEGGLDDTPHLVVSGINAGQNIGPIAAVSGTVGAARTAARRGIPALAVSQGLASEPDWPVTVAAALEWIEANRAALLDGSAEVTVMSINAPTCSAGEVAGVVEVPLADDIGDFDVLNVACDDPVDEPAHDVEGFATGWVVLTDVGLG